MPYLHSAMILKILSIRTSLESSISRAHRGRKPQARTAKAMASKSGLYSESNGQLMNTPWAYSFRAIRHRGLRSTAPGGTNLPDRLQQLGKRKRIGRMFRHRYHGFTSRLFGHLSLRISPDFYRRTDLPIYFAILPRWLPEEQYSGLLLNQNNFPLAGHDFQEEP